MSSEPGAIVPDEGDRPFAIRVRDLSKHYLIFDKPEDRLKQMVVPRLERMIGRPPSRYYREFGAVNGVSFEIGRGETVGIVGRNGSGKSTLLQMICGTLQPSAGTVEVNGRVAALLELGTGFNPEFTGRENVFLNGAILGLSHTEIGNRFDAIAAFADIGQFIEQPVKTYSSGMYVRLAFATAINVDPDILVVDEALAVGDEAFQRKCFARIEDIKDQGGTILFVSHTPQSIVQLCSRAILMDRGEMLLEAGPKLVVSHYQRLNNLTGAQAEAVREQIRGHRGPGTPDLQSPDPTTSEPVAPGPVDAAAGERGAMEGFDPQLASKTRVEYESQGAVIREPRVLTAAGQVVNVLEPGGEYRFEYVVDFTDAADEVGFGMVIKTVSGFALGGASSSLQQADRLRFVPKGARVNVRFRFRVRLGSGTYFLNAGVTSGARGAERYLHRVLDGTMFRVAPSQVPRHTGLIDFGIELETEVEALT